MSAGESAPALQLENVSKRFGSTTAADRIDLTVESGEFFTLLGPSGSGKSTVLRMIAGLERPDSGVIRIDSREMQDVPPWHRRLGMVFQQYALFPHMDAAQNVAYGLRLRKVPRQRVEQRVSELLQLVGLAGFEKKPVTVLSGGEQQRVALARGLALEPSLLLLDEPLGALDEKIRREMQVELKSIQREARTTFVYVTHDQEEALTVSDRIAVMHRGQLLQCDRPERIFRRPRTCFVASFFRGCNVLQADLVGRDGDLQLRLAGAQIAVAPPSDYPAPDDRVPVGLRAEDVHIGREKGGNDVEVEVTIKEVVYRGTSVDYLVELADGQDLVATSTRREPGLEPGGQAAIGFSTDDVVPLLPD
jgi:ABC-type Fe3+/spermidine/putrescine transport system ATPase subunit